MSTFVFRDRTEAGQILATHLYDYAAGGDTVVLGLPRGGVPVAYEIARCLHAPLDVCVVRKLGVPDNPELAMGAIGSGDYIATNPRVLESSGVSEAAFEETVARERRELQRREQRYRGDRPPLNVRDRRAIVVDDGVATGATAIVAIATLRQQHPKALAIAVPVASPSVCDRLAERTDAIVCPVTPEPFRYLGLWYEDFSPTSDETVCHLLNRQARQLADS